MFTTASTHNPNCRSSGEEEDRKPYSETFLQAYSLLGCRRFLPQLWSLPEVNSAKSTQGTPYTTSNIGQTFLLDRHGYSGATPKESIRE